MVCFDYDEVTCSVCKRKTVDGYTVVGNVIVCDECRDRPAQIADDGDSETAFAGPGNEGPTS